MHDRNLSVTKRISSISRKNFAHPIQIENFAKNAGSK